MFLGILFWFVAQAAINNVDVISVGGDHNSSASFQQVGSDGQNATGESSSSNFSLKSGFLYYSEQYSLTITKSGSGGGDITSSPSGINCGTNCVANFDTGTLVTLTAVPNSNSFFTGWSGGGCSGTSNCIVTINSSVTVTATFNIYSAPSTSSVVSGGGGWGGGVAPCYPPKGDINRDCRVNLVDLSILAYWWEKPLPPITVDINRNGEVDMGDFSILVFYWTG